MHRTFYPAEMSFCNQLSRMLGGHQSRSERYGEEINPLLRPCLELNHGRPTLNLLSIQAELHNIQANNFPYNVLGFLVTWRFNHKVYL
jgi:hypothetical protein